MQKTITILAAALVFSVVVACAGATSSPTDVPAPTDQSKLTDLTADQRPDAPLPSLAAPPGVQQSRTGKGGSGRSYYTSMSLEAAISAEEVESHYRDQLTDAEWTLFGNGQTAASAWSTWRFTDDDGIIWGAALLVTRNPGAEDSLFAHLRASQARQILLPASS